MPIHWPQPKLASVDDIPSWERVAPTLAVSFGRLQEEKWLKAWPGGDLDAKDEEGWSALQRAAAEGMAVAVKELLRRPGVEVNGVEPTKGQPALVLASRGGHEEVVRVLLACAEVEVNHAVQGDYTALFIAAQLGHESVVGLLLSNSAVDPNSARPNGVTPLWIAAEQGHEAVVRLLLAHAAVDPNQAIQNGATPLFIAAELGHEAVVRRLLAHAAIEPNKAMKNGVTPLFIAALKGQEVVVRLLLSHAALNPNHAEEQGYTPLHIAAQQGNEAVVKQLLAHAAIDPDQARQDGRTPLVLAAEGGHSAVVELLAPRTTVSYAKFQEEEAAKWLAAWPGGDLDAKDEEGWSALQRAAAVGQAVAVKELLRRPGVEVNGVEPARGQTALFLASRLGHAAVVRALLACAEVELNYDVGGGYTALYIAALEGHEAAVELLLAHAAVDPNQADEDGGTPLFIAAQEGHGAIVELLLAHAAVDPNQADQEGCTPLFIAAQKGHEAMAKLLLAHAAVDANQADQEGFTPLYIAAGQGHEAVVKLLLTHAAVDPNQPKQNGATPLFIAAQKGHGAIVQLLLAHAAVDANQADQVGRTPLWTAASFNQEATLRLLLAHPAVDAERANQFGNTPLLAACLTRSTAAALALLEAKADPNARDSNGDSPLVIARRGDNAQLLAALVAAGADVAALYPPLVAKCMLGDAHAARSLLLESASAARAFQVLDIDEGLARNFRSFDADRSGDIDAAELQRVLERQGIEVDAAQAQQVLAKFDRNGTGKLDLHAFWRFTQAPGWAKRSPALRLKALLSEAPAQEPPGAAGDDEEAGLPAHVKVLLACLRGDAAALAALDGSDACEACADGLPPAFCLAVELGDAAVVKAALAGAKGLDEPQRAVLCAQAALAAGTHDAAASGYVPGARYHATLLALAGEGLIDVAKCAAVKALFLGYLGSVAAAAHMAAAPRAFAELKKAMEARLEVIAAPLERLYVEERLGARLGALGEATLGAKVALDDDGLLPMPKYILGYPPSSTGYEDYLLRLIVMASVALDNLFVRKLRSALEALGDPTKTEVDDRDVRIHGSDGALLLTITRAPVKSRARMLNKLESAEDHRDKPLPRPKYNVDTVRAGVVVEDAGMMAAVLEAIGAHVGRLLRSKNAFREDAEVSYGYRAFLGNLQLESGLTVGEVFGGEQRAKWQALARAGAAADAAEPAEVRDMLDALLATSGRWYDEDNAGVAALPLNIAAEVQLIYKPYLERGRKLSHLPYKVVRCAAPSELARDAGGKRAVGEEQREAARACGEIVEGLLAARQQRAGELAEE